MDGDATATVGPVDGAPNGDPAPTTDRNGAPAGAVLFDGNDNYILPKASFPPTFTAGTLTAWVRNDTSDGSERGPVAVGGSGGGSTQYFTMMRDAHSGGNDTYRTDLDDGAARRETDQGGIPQGQWVHLAASFTAGEDLKLYVNGRLADSTGAGAAASYTWTNDWVVGAERTGSRYWIGAVDDVSVFDEELPRVKIADIAAGSSPADVANKSYTAIIVTDNQANEANYKTLLEGLGLTVTVSESQQYRGDLDALDLDGVHTKKENLSQYDLIIVDRTTNSGDYNHATDWNSLDVPLILNSTYIVRNSRWHWINTGGQENRGVTDLTVDDPTHPIMAGLTGQMNSPAAGTDMPNVSGVGNGSLIASETLGGAARPVIVEFERNRGFYNNADQWPAERRFFLALPGSFPTPELTANGQAIVEQAVLHALALGPEPQDIITHAVRTGGSDPDEPIIENQGLFNDVRAFTDRDHEWNNLPPAHPELVGTDYIRIANDDRVAANFRLNVGLSTDATVYVFKDNRVNQAAMSQWLDAYGFIDTGLDVGVDESGDGDIDQTSRVFWGNFPKGAVDLFQQNQGGTNMYGVAAVAGHLAPDARDFQYFAPVDGYLEDPGQAGRLVMEAEHFSFRQDATFGGGKTWAVMPGEDFPGSNSLTYVNARGGEYIEALPNGGPGGNPNEAPYTDYVLHIDTPGEYRLWARWDGNNTGTEDSFYAGIVELADGTGGTYPDWYRFSRGGDLDFDTGAWHGDANDEDTGAGGGDGPAVWTIPAPGNYTLRVSMREDGAGIDALVFQLSSLSAPSGQGPAETDTFQIIPALDAFAKLGGDPDTDFPVVGIGSLRDGMPAYVDDPAAWSDIPQELVGADYVVTENDDAGYSFVDYSLILDDEALAYIFMDDAFLDANGIPKWATDLGFVLTDYDVLQGNDPFSILQRYPNAGDIRLGGLDSPDARFYGIAISDVFLIPEPSTFVLLALGGLLARRRRR
jgi:hypothetical protein